MRTLKGACMPIHLSTLEWFDLIGIVVAVLAPPAIAWIDWLGCSRANGGTVPTAERNTPIAAVWWTLSVLVGIVVVLTNFQLIASSLFEALELWPVPYACVVVVFLTYDSVRIVRGLRRLTHNSPQHA